MTVLAPERPPQRTEPVAEPPRPRAQIVRPALAAWCGAAAAAWMLAGPFATALARALALAAVTIGVGFVTAGARAVRPAVWQYAVLAAAVVAGIGAALTAGAGASIPALVVDAMREDGLAQPPVPFEPGWRFLLVAVGVLIGAGATSLALAAGRAPVGVLAPLPLLVGGALLQPSGSEAAASAVALGLVLAGLAVASGSELPVGEARATVERRRILRGLIGALALAGVLVALSRADALFPARADERVIPPHRPPAAGPQPDRVLFTVRSETPGPWRLGVLDVYDGLGWLLPPFEPARLTDPPPPAATVTATFTIADLPGRVLPAPASPSNVRGVDVLYDPRTQTLRVARRIEPGTAYTLDAPATPGGRALAETPPPPPSMQPFLEAPAPPNEVVTLLAEAPENPWDRLVFVRERLFSNVVAAGAGDPVDVPPERVAALLEGTEATPYEITAAEALLARWAGVPARIGFGFFGGESVDGGFEVRPRHGRTWLEVYFEGHGWVPVVGVPPRARTSLSPAEQQDNPNVVPSERLALIVHVPIRLQGIELLAATVRWWLVRIVPIVAVAALAWWALPGVLKVARARRRRRWARTPLARIAVAYASFRDAAADLGLHRPGSTPVAFLDALEPDDEHAELAWLVTRALWGDLRRDVRDDDASAADEMARSLTRRLRRAQPVVARIGAFGARTSLRDPSMPDLPRAPRLRPATAATLLVLAGCAGTALVAGRDAGVLPQRIVPSRLAALRFEREPSAERAYDEAGDASLLHDGRVYTIRDGTTVEGYVQAVSFVAGIDARDPEVRTKILRSIAAGRFRLERIGDERVWVQQLPEQKMFLSFSADGGAMTLLVARNAFERGAETFVDLLAHQRGTSAGEIVETYDPRRGAPR